MVDTEIETVWPLENLAKAPSGFGSVSSIISQGTQEDYMGNRHTDLGPAVPHEVVCEPLKMSLTSLVRMEILESPCN